MQSSGEEIQAQSALVVDSNLEPLVLYIGQNAQRENVGLPVSHLANGSEHNFEQSFMLLSSGRLDGISPFRTSAIFLLYIPKARSHKT